MSSILAPRPTDRPPQDEPWGRGVTISVAAHLALVAALWWGVHWRNHEPEGVSAELWAAVPEAAAPQAVAPPPPAPAPAPTPAPVPPPPPPVAQTRPPDIVTEQLKEKERQRQQQQQQQQKLEQQKLEQQKADQAKADAAKKADQQKALDAQKLAKLHDENVHRMLAQMNGTGAPDAAGTAARSRGPSASYAGRILARVRPNIVFDPSSMDGNPETEVEVRCAPDGTIVGRRITKSSGVAAWDDAVVRAIDRTAVLPRDTDGSIPTPMTLVFHPKDLVN
jgi:colicin import membrane protein